MKILMLIDRIGVGGTETHIFTLCEMLSEFNKDTLIATIYNNEDTYKQNNIVIDEYKHCPTIESLLEIIKLYNIDVVHCHSIEAMLMARQLYEILPFTYIVTFHGLYYQKNMLNYICEKSKHIIAVSQPVKDFLIENIDVENINKISIIYNGVKIIDNDSFEKDNTLKHKLGIPDNTKVILYCSRLSFSKGRLAEIFIHKIKNLVTDNIYVLIAGDGVKKKAIDFYANQINKKNNNKKIIILGNINDMNSYYSISDIVVGTGRVAIEALNFAKPVICFGIKDYLGIFSQTNHEYILNTYFGDHGSNKDIEKLNIESSIKYLLENQDKYKNISDWSKQYCINNFDLEKLVAEYINIINM